VKVPNTTANSFYIQIGNCARLMGGSTSIPANTWTWIDYQNGSTTNKVNYDLTAGTHVVTIIGNQPGVGVDKILMTKNLSCVPTGTSGDNCPAEIPTTNTPTPTTGAADTTKPVISNPRVEEVTGTTAKVRWELSENASGRVEYRAVGSSTWLQTGLQPCTPTDCVYNYHIQSISGLTNNTTYEYRITSTDAAGNQADPTNPSICRFTTGGASTQSCASTAVTNTPTPSPRPTTVPATNTPTRIPTLTPSLTPVPNSTILRLNSVKLHGIGRGGTNANANEVGNENPLRTSRPITIELINSSGNSLPELTGNVIYKPTTGDFGGDIITNNSIPSGSYLVKVKSPGYLKRQLIGIVNVVASTTNTLPNVALVTGDINNDNTLSISDYVILQDCYTEFLPPRNCNDQAKKTSADLTDNGTVNTLDVGLFLRELSVFSGN
jgi:hypothetical protein